MLHENVAEKIILQKKNKIQKRLPINYTKICDNYPEGIKRIKNKTKNYIF